VTGGYSNQLNYWTIVTSEESNLIPVGNTF
jgi:hypothetical protein